MNSVNDLNSRPTIRIHPSSERPTDSMPLLVHESTNRPNEKPPLANPEMDDLDDDKTEHDSTTPYFGIDDSLFDKPETNHIPDIGFRAAGTDDETDGLKPNSSTPSNRHSPVPGKPGTFPYAPSFGHDLEVGTIPGDFESIPDINVYQHKKTLAQGMMDLALFSANANQLRYVIESFNRHPYYYPSLILISFSLLLQVSINCDKKLILPPLPVLCCSLLGCYRYWFNMECHLQCQR